MPTHEFIGKAALDLHIQSEDTCLVPSCLRCACQASNAHLLQPHACILHTLHAHKLHLLSGNP